MGPFVVGAAATGGAAAADGSVRNYFEPADRWDGFDPIGRRFGASQILGPIVGVSFLTSRFTKNDRYQRFTYELAQGFVATNVLTAGIKVASGRERPDKTSQYSFPSGHTSNSFMWATVVSRTYGWKAGIPSYAFAAYVGASRLKSRKHFLSDVVAGATLGYIVGRTVTRRGRNQDRRLTWGLGVPDGGGVALNISIRPRASSLETAPSSTTSTSPPSAALANNRNQSGKQGRQPAHRAQLGIRDEPR